MGLLDMLGGNRAQMPGQSRGGFGQLLAPEVALPMAAALMGNQGNMQNIGNAFGQGGQALAQTRDSNTTYQWLQQNAPEYAQLMDGGMDGQSALAIYAKNRFAEPTKGTDDMREYEYAKGNGMFDGSFTEWQTKGIREQDPTFGREQDLRKEYGGTPEFKRYDEVRASYERVRSSATMDSGAGDIGTIFGFMKMLDPGSVVREGEFATAQNSSGVPDRVRNLYNNVVNGERLTPEQRAEFVRTADSLYQNEEQRVQQLNDRFTGIAGEYELDPSRIVQQPRHFEPLQIGAPPATVAPGVTIRKVR
jgi:hypothetical protein